MTPGMSLSKWDELGMLSRELNIYQKLGEEIGRVYIYSYGNNEGKYTKNYPNIEVISKYWFFPEKWRGQKYINLLYNTISIILRYRFFKNIDVVKTNQFRGSGFGYILKKIFGCRFVVRMGFYYNHFQGLTPKDYSTQKKFFQMADKIIVTEGKAAKFIKTKYNLPINKVVCFKNYIDTEIFKPINYEKNIDILYVGRVNERKNIENLLKSLVGLNLNIMLIGKGNEKYINDLENIANKNNLKVSFIQRVNNNDLVDIYNRSKIYILPSFFEGNPKTLLEAMSCGCACIGTDVNGINNILSNKFNGLLCETNADDIFKAVDELINNNKLRKYLGFNAREYILDNCSMENLLSIEVEIYRKLLKR